MVLRILITRNNNPEKWSGLNRLMDHRKECYEQDRPTWDQLQVEIVDYLLNDLALSDLYDEETIQKCIGIIRINGINSTDQIRKIVRKSESRAKNGESDCNLDYDDVGIR